MDVFQVEEITRLDALEGIRDEWSALCDRSVGITPFQRPEWLIPWWRAFPPGEPWTLAVRREGRLAALAPFLVYGDPRTVAFCGGGVSDYCDVITDQEEAMTAIWTHLEKRRDLWEIGDFEPVPDTSPLLRVSPVGIETHIEMRDVCPGLALPDRVEDLGDVVPTRQLSNLRKYRRKAGDPRLVTEPWEELLDTVLRLYRHGPLGEDVRAFHREVAAGFHARGALGLYALRLDSQPLAALYGFREGDTFYCYMQGFDPARASSSPGVMIVGSVIEDAIRQGVRRIDFLRGRETYKYWWGARDRETFRRRLNPSRSSPAPGA